ncbi:MAG TPA: hypothetical protein ENN19_04275 [Chloroflexi bacterium]|nr:hypothetical protein [Chloroflexota bacterium]
MVQVTGNFSLLTAILGCLALWNGAVLLMEQPMTLSPADHASTLPWPATEWQDTSQTYRSLVSGLLFWLPLGLGAIACGAGVITLACGRERCPEITHRTLIALILGIIPGCLFMLWVVVATSALGR